MGFPFPIICIFVLHFKNCNAKTYQLKKYDETEDYLQQFKIEGYLDKENNKTYNALLALSYYLKKKPDYMQGLQAHYKVLSKEEYEEIIR